MTIEQQLITTWKRERGFCHLRGFCRSVIWLMSLLFLVLIIDFGIFFKVRLPAHMSIILGVAGLGVMAWVVWRYWISQLRPYDATRIALEVEARHPELMSSLISYTELETISSKSEASPELLQAMSEFAVDKSRQVKFSDVIDFTQLKALIAVSAIVMLVSAGVSMRWSDHVDTLLKRLAGVDTTYPIQTKLVEITGDVVVPVGRNVEIKVSAGGVIPDAAVLNLRSADDPSRKWAELPMEKLANGFSFLRRLETPDRNLHYSVTMGDYRSEPFKISVVHAPRVVKTMVTFTPPAYLNRSVETSDQLNAEVAQGTRIDWKLTCDKKVDKLTVTYRDQSLEATVASNGTDLSFSLPAEKSFAYTFAWTEGGSGQSYHFEDVEYTVKVIRDAKPRIDFVGRAPNGPATLSKTVAAEWWAKDDYGLGKLWLVYSATTPDSPDTPTPNRKLLHDLKGLISDSDTLEWHPGKDIADLKSGHQVDYHLELTDLMDDPKGERIARTKVTQMIILSNEEYLTWFRRELKSRNDLVKQTFVAERAASKQIKLILLENEVNKHAEQLRNLESTQSAEARKMAKVAGDLAWLFDELASNKLIKEGGGKQLKTYADVLRGVADTRLPTVTKHLRDARLEVESASYYLTSAKKEVDAIVEDLKRVLASSSTLLLEEALVTELRDMIKVESELRENTAIWGKALLISPETAGTGKGPLMLGQRAMLERYQNFLKQLQKAKGDALDDAAKALFEQVENVLNPPPPTSDNRIVQSVLAPEPTTGEVLKAAADQIEGSDALSAVGAQDRAIAAFKSALQILSAGQFDLGEFVAGIEKLIEKQKVLLKAVEAEKELEKKSAFYEARQVEIMNEVTDYSFNAPDLFVSDKGEFLVEPLMNALADAVDQLQNAKKEEALTTQARVITLLESVYGTALQAKEEKESDPFWAYSPEVPEDKWKLPDDGDEEDMLEEDEDMPEIFEGITSAELMIQSDNSKGAQADVSTAMAANRMLNFDEGDEDEDGPDYITDEGPPSVGMKKDAPSDPGGKGEGNKDAVEKDRLAKESMERRRRKAKVQNYLRQLPPEFRRAASDYYEVIAK